MSELFSRTLGDGGPLIVFCHGLLGQGRNWTQIARALADQGHRCALPDLPDHGRSPWTETFDYDAMADAVRDSIGDEAAIWVGHSMGAKVAMRAALRHPETVRALAVVDMSPVAYTDFSDSGSAQYLRALAALDLSTLTDRAEADDRLVDQVPDPVIRGFLLQNLRRDGDRWRFQPNLAMLEAQIPRIAGWAEIDATYDGPTLWLAGAESDYVRPEHHDPMKRLFPASRLITVKRAGHWVHSEQPAVVTEILSRFASREP